MRPLAKPLRPIATIERQCGGADQHGHLTCRDTAQQVHLEEAVLRMDVAGGIGDVKAIAAVQCRHAECIALNRHGRRQQRCGARAIELRKARA